MSFYFRWKFCNSPDCWSRTGDHCDVDTEMGSIIGYCITALCSPTHFGDQPKSALLLSLFVYLYRNFSNNLPSFLAQYLRQGEGKVKLSLCFNRAPRHGGLLRSGNIDPHVLDLGTGWRWMVSFTVQLYPQRKTRRYLLDRRLGGPQSRSGCSGEESAQNY
jgi:hypothetical protein